MGGGAKQTLRGSGFVLERVTLEGGRTVLVKTVAPDRRDERSIANLRREHEILRRLDLPGIARAIGLEDRDGAPALVLEDAGREDLSQWLAGRAAPIGVFLDVALQLAETVARLHERNVVHRNVNPSNLLLDDAGRVTLIDFHLATGVVSLAEAAVPAELDGTLPYMSPEQTGRMARLVDHRSDLYALGATFYEVLTGSPPFPFADPLAIVHAHLARVPAPPSVVNPLVPEVLSEVVLKLLAKMPERRYQSAEALSADLREARQQWLSSGTIAPFELGRLDLARQLPLPEGLYGRDGELAELRALLDRASAGRTELVLVEGDTGIGKTALVETLRGFVAERGGRFVSGKFDLRAASAPYASIAEALRNLVRSLRAEPEDLRAALRPRIQGALGANGRAITQVLPELEELIGEQPPLAALDPLDAQRRFHLALQAFLQAFATGGRPLALFLDDLQWADVASVEVLRALATDPDSHHMLLLGAFRPGEVGAHHALAGMLDELRRAGVAVRRVELGPLDLPAVQQLLGDALRADGERVRALAELVLGKTAGNPFFIRQLLRSLQKDGLLSFDLASGAWTWDADCIERVSVSDNVVDLLVGAIRRLPKDVEAKLSLAACIGKRFDLRTLAALSEKSEEEAGAGLQQVIREGLLVADLDGRRGPAVAYQFAHDRVQQAAYSLLPDEQRRAQHHRIGRTLMELCSGDAEVEERLFDIVDQQDLGSGLVTAAGERIDLARWNHRAGLKARRSAAYGPALAYFHAGIALLPESAWREHHALAFLLHRDAAECAYLSGDYALSERLVEEALARAASVVERTDLYAARVISATVKGNWQEAIGVGRDALRLLGHELPERDIARAIAAERRRIKVALRGRDPRELLDAPLTDKAEDRAFLKLLTDLMPPAWFADRDFFVLVTFRALRFTLEHGHSPKSVLTYSSYAVCLTGADAFDAADAFSHLALDLAQRFGDRASETGARGFYVNFVVPWRAPLASVVPLVRQVHAMGLACGELRIAALALAAIVCFSFFQGAPLDEVLRELTTGLPFLRKTDNQGVLNYHLIWRQVIRCLKGLTRERGRLQDDDFDEAGLLAATQADSSLHGTYDILRLQVSYLFRDLAEARARSESALPFLEYLAGAYPSAMHNLYTSLTLAALCDGAPAEQRAELLARIEANQRRLGVWAESCPETFRHKHLLVAAEVARVEGRHLDASDLYDQAIDRASRAGFLQEEALANELCGRYYHALGRHRGAHPYLCAAGKGFARWGAIAKARALEDEFPELRKEALSPAGLTPEESAGAALDLMSVLKAAEAISGEIALASLLDRLITVCVEAAGAERGVLVLEEEGAPFVRAVGRIGEPVAQVCVPVPEYTEAPRNILDHVRSTREPLILGDAAHDVRFATDRYVAERQAKSVLVIPIERHSALVGMFYFENNLATQAFSPLRTRLMAMLSSQIGVSLENSLLFEKVKVAERAVRFLADASALLAESLDESTTLRSMARLIVPVLADWCVFDLLGEDGRICRVAGAHADPAKERLLRELSERYAPDWTSPQPAARVIISGKPVLVPEVTEAVRRTYTPDVEIARINRELGSQSFMVVPLIARGKTLGAISLVSAAPGRSYGPCDLALAEELAHRAAMAIDSARLYREAQEGIRVREDFLSIASHELKTPITTMKLAIHGFFRNRAPSSLEQIERVLRRTDRQLDRLLQLVNDLLDVAQIHAGKIALHLEQVDLAAVVNEIVEHFRDPIAQSGSQVDIYAVGSVIGLWDRSRLEQVVANLLGNALKFGDGKAIAITVTQRAGAARLVVEDHGIGIPPERLPHVFERFERAVSVQNYGGFGLGLHIVWSIVQALGGKVRVDSTPHVGSKFTVDLPCGGPPSIAPAAAARAAAA